LRSLSAPGVGYGDLALPLPRMSNYYTHGRLANQPP
jgi:hypothetical protein